MDESLIIGFDFELISFTQLDSFITCKWCNASFHIVMAIQRVGPNFVFHFVDLSPVVSICSRHSFMRYTDMRLLRSNYINNYICYCLCSSYQIINICILTILTTMYAAWTNCTYITLYAFVKNILLATYIADQTEPKHFVETMTVLIKYEKDWFGGKKKKNRCLP